MFILSLVSGSWQLIEDMGPPVQLLLQQSKYFHGNKNLHLFYKAWDDRGKYRIRTPTFFFFRDVSRIIMFVFTEFRNISIQLNLVPFHFMLSAGRIFVGFRNNDDNTGQVMLIN